MSQENVERAHRALDAFNRRDLDGFVAFMDADVELTARFMEMEGKPYFQGHAGVREWWRSLLAVFPDFRIDVVEAYDHGDSLILRLRVRGHGRDSGVPLDAEVWQAGRVRAGKVTWWRNFETKAGALEAAGLAE